MSDAIISMHDSGVRRFTKGTGNFVRRMLAYVIPMAPRKHPDDKQQVDQSVVVWRSFMTLVNTAMIALTAYIASHIGGNDANIQNTLDRVDRRLGALEAKVEAMNGKVEYVSAFVDGMRKAPHL